MIVIIWKKLRGDFTLWLSKLWPQDAKYQKYANDYQKLSKMEICWDEAWIAEENMVLLALESSGLGG
jgi:hypothetical protein